VGLGSIYIVSIFGQILFGAICSVPSRRDYTAAMLADKYYRRMYLAVTIMVITVIWTAALCS